jgi:hypothetical protein
MGRWLALSILPLALAGFGPAAPPQDGVVIEEAGFGFLPSSEPLNFPSRSRNLPAPKFVGKFDSWVPFQAILVNHGPALEGVLTLKPSSPGTQEGITYSRRITLPSKGRKRVAFPVRASYEPMILTFRDDRVGGVRIGGEWEVLIREPRIVNPRTEVVLLVTDAPITYGHYVFPRRRTDQPPDRLLVVVAPDQLPHTALEYDLVGLLVLDDIAADGLAPSQASAIHQWVCRGGALVMTLLRNAHRVKGTHLEPLLAGPIGQVRNAKEMKPFEEATTRPCRFEVETAVQTFVAGEGSEGDPALLQRRIERGLSIACGLPLSSKILESWTGAPLLLESFRRLGRPWRIHLPGGPPSQTVRDPIATALKGSVLKSVPPFKAVSWLMIGYIVILVVVPYAVLRPFKRLELAWFGIVGLALVGCGVVYGVGVKYLRTESVACRVTLVEGGGSPGPHLRHNFWCLFSAGGGAVDLGFEESSVVPYPFGRSLGLRGAGSAADPLEVSYDPGQQIRALPTYAQDSVLFETTDSVALPGSIRFQVQWDPQGGLTGRVEVDEKFPLRDAWILDGARVIPVRPGPFAIPAVAPRAGVGGSLLERKGFEAVTQAVNYSDSGRHQPVLLYRYDGSPSLTNADIQEDAVHFGIVEASVWRDPLAGQALWRGVIYLPPEESAAARKDYEFTLRTRDFPAGSEPETLILDPGSFSHGWPLAGKFELFDRQAEAWKPATAARTRLAPFLVRSPFGGHAVKARYVASNEFEMQEVYSYRQGGISELQITGTSTIKAAKK